MTTFHIIDQAAWTTRRAPSFVGRIEHVLHTVAPMVERHAAMGLPRQVTVRLMTPTTVRAATRLQGHLVGEAVAKKFAGQAEKSAAYWWTRDSFDSFARFQKTAWPLIGGRVIVGHDGPYVAIMPAMHVAKRTSDRALMQTLGHELVHIMQRRQLPDLDHLLHAQLAECRLGQRGQHDVLPMPLIVEGHAMWVHRLIVAELGGVLDDFPGDPRAEAWLRRRACRLRAMQNAFRQNLYLPGQNFMTALARAGKAQLVASIFDGENRLPSSVELDNPGHWLKRLHPELALPDFVGNMKETAVRC